MSAHTCPPQTKNKNQSFSSDIQIKSKCSSGNHIIRVLCAYDSFIKGVWNADRATGSLFLIPPNHYETILSYKSFFSFPPASLFSLYFWWFINAGTLHAPLTEMSPRLLALSVHLFMWNWSCFVAFGHRTLWQCPQYNWQMFVLYGVSLMQQTPKSNSHLVVFVLHISSRTLKKKITGFMQNVFIILYLCTWVNFCLYF